jgi:ubiquinone/menaquinone biosynthesis C-methylase UbiE
VELLFRVWSPFYDNAIFQRTFYRRVHARMLASLGGEERRRVLDLGCGTAQLTGDLQRRYPAAMVTGLDLSGDMLAAAKKRLGDAAPPLVRANVYALPLADASVDLVTSSISYHWYLEPRRALAEVARVLEPGGRFVLATMSSILLNRRLASMRLATVGTTRADLEASGFRVVAVERLLPIVTVFVADRP